MERLQKVIAQSGLCSRRKAEELIKAGRVKVNGVICDELGTKVGGDDEILVNGKALERQEHEYYVLNKPKGCISSAKDPQGRPTVLDYLPKGIRLYPVGRLDFDTSGVLLVTNDGKFTNLMTHPRYHLDKTYRVNLQGMITPENIKALKDGLVTKEEKYQPARVKVVEKDYARNRCQILLTIAEGKNHQVKNMMEALGLQVRKLHRVSFAGISADDMRPGEYRRLKPFEYKELIRKAASGSEQ